MWRGIASLVPNFNDSLLESVFTTARKTEKDDMNAALEATVEGQKAISTPL